MCLAGVAVMAVLLGHGFHEPPLPFWALRALALLSFGASLAVVRLNPSRPQGEKGVRNLLYEAPFGPLRQKVSDTFFALSGSAGILGATDLVPGAWVLFEMSLVLLLVGAWSKLNLALSRSVTACVLLVPFNFLLLIAAGTLVLKTPEALRIVTENPLALRDPIGGKMKWLDALFTMTSAVCLTGLTVRDIAQFSGFGQTAIVLFIQVGGLAAAVAGSVLIVLRVPAAPDGDSRGPRSRFDSGHARRITSLVAFVVTVTLVCEFVGALAMMPLWPRAMAWSDRMVASLFHSISAFCNSGFALPVDSLQSHRHSMLSHLVVAPLVLVGGLGFPVLRELWRAVPPRGLRRVTGAPLSTHSRVVLAMTFALYLCGTAAFAVPHLMSTAANQPVSAALSWQRIGGAIADGSFMSLSARSGGFTTVPTDGLEPAAEVVLMTQMIVGASPGGTGGGMKTTVVALLLIAAARLLARRRGDFPVLIPASLLLGACAVALFFGALIAVATTLLCVSESIPLRRVLFESVSAAGASGLSSGITAQLTRFGKVVIIATMFLGRVVPLMIAFVVVCGGRRGEMGGDQEVLIG